MPTFAHVGEEGEGLSYIDDPLAGPPPVAEKGGDGEEAQAQEGEIEEEQYEEGSTPPEEIPYEQIEEQPEEEVSEDTAINMAVDAAIKAVAVAPDTSLVREEGSDENEKTERPEREEPEPKPQPEHDPATKVTVHMYRTEEPRTVGSPPSYRRPESPRAVNSKIPTERKGSTGILRAEGGLPRRRSTGDAGSPAPSTDRVSVTFAVEDGEGSVPTGGCDEIIRRTEGSTTGRSRKRLGSESPIELSPAEMQQLVSTTVEVVDETAVAAVGNGSAAAAAATTTTDGTLHPLFVDIDDDEYTDSVLEIQRSLSRGGSGRRRSSGSSGRRLSDGSSLFSGHQRRKPSSSGFTVASSSIADAESLMTKSSLSERDPETLKLHKEVIEQTKFQIWSLDKKLRVIRTAKDYVRRHEHELEAQLAQDKTFRSRLQQSKMQIIRFFLFLWRMIRTLGSEITPWQQRIKDIESHFGSVVSSYFTFLRWIFWMNMAITMVLTTFVIVPEVLAADRDGTGARKKMLPVEEYYGYNLKVMWDFNGILRYSPIFYGYYSSKASTKAGYQIPLAYFCAGMSVYIFSFYMILKKMQHNAKQSKLSEKSDECTFTWKVYTTWDYSIANIETAHNKVASVVMGFKEGLVEEMEKGKMAEKNWKTVAKRVLANFLFVVLLVLSAYGVIVAVDRSKQAEAENSWYRQNEITIVMTMISIVVPNFFELIALLESYHPRKAMRWMLGRIMALNLLSLYTLIFALFDKTYEMQEALQKIEHMTKAGVDFGLDLTTASPPIRKDCFTVPIPCELLSREETSLPAVLSLFYEFEEEQSKNGFNVSGGFLFDLYNTSSPNFTMTKATSSAAFTTTTRTSSVTSTISTTKVPNEKENSTTTLPTMVTNVIDLWLRNITRKKVSPEEDEVEHNCKSCLERCGEECLDLCNVVLGCEAKDTGMTNGGGAQMQLKTTNMTSLILLLRKTANMTGLFRREGQQVTEDPFDRCHSCASDASYRGSGDHGNQDNLNSTTSETTLSSTTIASSGFVPVEERHCTKSICRRRFFGSARPKLQPPKQSCDTAKTRYRNDLKEKLRLRKLCWETMFGQELVKLTVLDTVFTIGTTFVGDFMRAFLLRVLNPCWFWDLEKKFPKYPDFKVAENILHLVNNQGMIWMGLFMAPGLPAINLVKLVIIMYVRSWAVMTTNVPHETVFRASRSNNFYFILLLMMLFLCTLPVAYTVVWLKPSWHCGPFSDYNPMYKVFTEKLMELLPSKLHGLLDYITSPGIVIPVLVLLFLVINYLISQTGLLRESNEDLKEQLHRERTEERRKLMQNKQGGGAASGQLSDRWKKLLGSAMSSTRDSQDYRRISEAATPGGETGTTYSERAIDVPIGAFAKPPKRTQEEREAAAASTLAGVIRSRLERKRAAAAAAAAATAEEAGKGEKTENSSKTKRNGNDKEHRARTMSSGSLVGPSEKGSMCNKFAMGDTESSSLSIGHLDDNVDEVFVSEGPETVSGENGGEGEKKGERPPKIWISKSASMEHDDLD